MATVDIEENSLICQLHGDIVVDQSKDCQFGILLMKHQLKFSFVNSWNEFAVMKRNSENFNCVLVVLKYRSIPTLLIYSVKHIAKDEQFVLKLDSSYRIEKGRGTKHLQLSTNFSQ
jgi:hypothetical protein